MFDRSVAGGIYLRKENEDRGDVRIDYNRFLDLLLRAVKDPQFSLGDSARGVRVGPGRRLPRQPALESTGTK